MMRRHHEAYHRCRRKLSMLFGRCCALLRSTTTEPFVRRWGTSQRAAACAPDAPPKAPQGSAQGEVERERESLECVCIILEHVYVFMCMCIYIIYLYNMYIVYIYIYINVHDKRVQ